MSRKSRSAIDALTRHQDERRTFEARGEALRRDAALELGVVVLDAGGAALGVDGLRKAVSAAVRAASGETGKRAGS